MTTAPSDDTSGGSTGSAESTGSADSTGAGDSTGAEDSTGSSGTTGSSAVCGDDVVEGNEDCDDGAESETCDDDCTTVECGDGLHNATAGEACDDGGESETCDDDCTAVECGDGVHNATAGEACDDGGESETCDDDCTAVECGDGVVNEAAGEGCDDGGTDDDDGCSATCQVEGADFVFLTSSNGSEGFYRYDVEMDTWSTMTSPPSTTRSQITNDGVNVYLMGADNVVYSYDIAADSWTAGIAGPGLTDTSSPIGFFQSFPGGFYYLRDATTTMYVHRGVSWSSFTLDDQGSCSGSYDITTGELYIRRYQRAGFDVIDTTDDSIVRTVANKTSVGENSRTGTYVGGNFYARTESGPILRIDAVTGAVTDTMETPLSGHTGTDADVATGQLYISGYGGSATSFQVFDTHTDTLTTLADQPSVSNHSTITVMRPPA